jgi:hypothetical protein
MKAKGCRLHFQLAPMMKVDQFLQKAFPPSFLPDDRLLIRSSRSSRWFDAIISLCVFAELEANDAFNPVRGRSATREDEEKKCSLQPPVRGVTTGVCLRKEGTGVNML